MPTWLICSLGNDREDQENLSWGKQTRQIGSLVWSGQGWLLFGGHKARDT